MKIKQYILLIILIGLSSTDVGALHGYALKRLLTPYKIGNQTLPRIFAAHRENDQSLLFSPSKKSYAQTRLFSLRSMMPTTQNYDRPGYWQQVKESSWGRWIRNLLTAGAGTAFYTIIQSRKNNALAEENPETSAELEFKKFEAKFAPPEEIKELLNNNKEIISKKNFGTITGTNGTPVVIIKGGDIRRIINAERLRRCIEENNLRLLAVAKKYYHEGKVFAEKIDAVRPDDQQLFTLEQIQQLTLLAEKTGYRDWDRNIIIDKQTGKIVFIDTEDDSFLSGMYQIIDETTPMNCKAQYALSLYILGPMMDQEAQQWLINHVEHLMSSPEGLAEDTPLPYSTKYDSPDINMEKVLEQFRKIERERHKQWVQSISEK